MRVLVATCLSAVALGSKINLLAASDTSATSIEYHGGPSKLITIGDSTTCTKIDNSTECLGTALAALAAHLAAPPTPAPPPTPGPVNLADARSCKDLYDMGTTTSGIYSIDHDGPGPAAATEDYCDMSTSGGGWTFAMNIAQGK